MSDNTIKVSFGKMRHRGKIALATAVLTAFAAALALWSLYDHAQESLEAAARSKLETVLLTRTAELVRYLNSVRIDLDLLATATHTAADFEQLARHWPGQESNLPTARSAVGHTNAIAMENRGADGYSQLHQQLHPSLHRYVDEKGYYDLFLILPNGTIAYSVRKESDFGTNLVTGPWAGSGLGALFESLSSRPMAGVQGFRDFQFYGPSGGAPASFVGQAVLNNAREFAGVLAFQMPVGRINAIMSDPAGLGETGQAYLVGSDGYLRTDARLEEQSTILTTQLGGLAAGKALAGSRGVGVGVDRAGRDIYMAYQPFSLMGASWAIVAEAGKTELHGPVHKLLTLAFIVVLLGVAAGLATAVTTRELTRPVRALLERERRLAQSLTDYLPESVALKDRDGRYQLVNKTYELWTGLERRDLIGKTVQELYPDDHARDIVGRDEIAAASQGPVSFEADREYADGVIRSVQITRFPVRDPHGEFVGLGTIHHDFTEIRGRERRIRQQSHFVQALHSATAAANEAPSLEEAIRVCLDCICTETGWPIGHAFLISATDDTKLVPSNVWRTGDATQFGFLRKVTAVTRLSDGDGLPNRAFQSGKIEWAPDLKADGDIPRANIMSDAGIKAGFAVPVRAGEGIAAVLEFYTDAYAQPSAQAMDLLKNIGTQLGSLMLRKRAHDALRASEKRLLQILDDSPAGATITSPGGETLFSNNRMGELLGEDWSEGVAGGRVLDRIAPNLSEALRRELQARGRVSEREAKIRRDDGTTFWAAVSLTSLDYQNQPCVLTWVYDVSVRKQAQSKLEAQSQLLGDVLESLTQGVVAFGPDRRIRAWNSQADIILRMQPGALRIGIEMAEIMDKSTAVVCVDGVQVDHESRINELWESAQTRKVFEVDDGVFDVRSHRTDDGGLLVTWSDITERRLAEQLAIEQREWLQLVVDQMPVGVVVYDQDDKIRHFNQAYVSSFNLGADEVVVGMSYVDIRALLESRISWTSDLREIDNLEHSEGLNNQVITDLTIDDSKHLQLVRTHMPGGGAIATQTDVTSMRQAEIELARARDEAQAANRAKSDFLASMSHEIRTPMNGVLGIVELLATTELTHEQSEMVTTVQDSGNALLTIINDILDFSKIEAGKLVLERAPLSLFDIVEGVGATLAPTSQAKGVNIITVVAPDLDVPFMGDPVRVRQILFNLGGNAVKFSNRNEPVVIRARRGQTRDDGKIEVDFHVVDRGIGIASKDQERLFEPFTQAQTSTTRKYGGTGLGLSICVRLIQLMGGAISVESEPDEGSDFRVSLPLSIGDAEAVIEHRDVLSDVHVVVTAKDEAQLEACKTYASSAGATVHTAKITPLIDAVALIPDGIPTSKLVVVCLCGFDAADVPALRDKWLAQASNHSVRFVITTDGTKAGGGSSRWNDAVTVESNPLRRHSLITGIAVAAGRASPRVLAPTSLLNVSRAGVPTVTKALANGQLILVAEDNVTNQDVIQRQLHALGYQCEVAEDGAEALAMWKTKNYAILLSDCHMPRMDGFELTAAIRLAQTESSEHLPIVAITANAIEGEAERCLAAGMDEYLSKPVQMRQLKEILAANIGPPTNAAPLAEQPATRPAEVVDAANDDAVRVGTSPVDGSVLLVMFGGDKATVREVLGEFMQPTWDVVAEIEQAWQIRSADGVKRASHKLKSSARSIGANALADLCEGLESAGREIDWARLDAGVAQIGGLVREVETYINAATA